jgi:hypothetical protein
MSERIDYFVARVQGVGPNAKTCFARLHLNFTGDQLVSIDFGFSDRVKIYHDRELLHEGDDTYRPRDHRFLGALGLHDRVTVRLHEGTNEALFAVSESLGGWGVLAAVRPTPGVRVASVEPSSDK